jgi:hypothetical protein
MTDRGILYSAPMVLAKLAGRKTQTRRLFNPRGFEFYTHPISGDRYNQYRPYRDGTWDESRISGSGPMKAFGWGEELYAYLPYAPGDRLWIKEAIGITEGRGIQYLADGTPADGQWIWKRDRLPSMFMRRRLSRMTDIIEEVRVQRLQDITEEDAKAEGAIAVPYGVPPGHEERDAWHHGQKIDPPDQTSIAFAFETAVDSYRHLWDQLNDKEGRRWSDNPWIVAYTFRTIPINIDQIAP